MANPERHFPERPDRGLFLETGPADRPKYEDATSTGLRESDLHVYAALL
jgi:hypothetical protein